MCIQGHVKCSAVLSGQEELPLHLLKPIFPVSSAFCLNGTYLCGEVDVGLLFYMALMTPPSSFLGLS